MLKEILESKMDNSVIRTERLILRPWRDGDLELFAQLNADPRVMEFFSSVKSFEDTVEEYNRIKNSFEKEGWGLWAASLKDEDRFIGFIGLNRVPVPFTPGVEVGWRLAYEYWGKGYATEGAKASLMYGFETLGLDEIISFTATQNKRSQNVMKKIGMSHYPEEDFDHPRLAEGHRLRRHVLYRIKKESLLTRVSELPPENFRPNCEVAACYVEIDGKILLMERSLIESEGKTWGVPAGKIEAGEKPLDGALRELFEETGIVVSASQVLKVGKLYIQKPKRGYVYHMFQVHLNDMPEVSLSDEHTRYVWADRDERDRLPLIGGAKETINYYTNRKMA